METQKTPLSGEALAGRAVHYLDEIRGLMELSGENPFKTRAFAKAVDVLRERNDLAERARSETLDELPGIGKGIAETLKEFILEGKTSVRDEYRRKVPAGLIELVQVPGLGPKKARVLVEELGVHSLAELEYACGENRLLELKGFGEKAQNKVLEGIRFLKSQSGKARLSEALDVSVRIVDELRHALGARVEEAGEVRRRLEIVEKMSFLVQAPNSSVRENAARALDSWKERIHVPLEVLFSDEASFGTEWARVTGSAEHLAELSRKIGTSEWPICADEVDFYHAVGIPWIPAEMREGRGEFEIARAGLLDQVVERVRGVFHNHTTESDGRSTLEEMVARAEELGYEYIGISDHSQSAYYAHGLKPDRLMEQEKAIRRVQENHPGIRVFWGVESDILADGGLDYTEAELSRFDFVIASVHSRFKMGREEMTERLVRAVRNPYTTMIGHLTGRLLLGRPGFEVDMERVIREAAEHDVALEINANPQRLDIDWRWGQVLRSARVKVSVNPDAHEVAGLEDTRYGLMMARKALMPRELVVNSWDVGAVEQWLRDR